MRLTILTKLENQPNSTVTLVDVRKFTDVDLGRLHNGQSCLTRMSRMTLLTNKKTYVKKFWATRAIWIGIAITAWIYRDELLALVEHASESGILARGITYCLVYVLLAGLNVPGAVLLTLLAGPLFGTTAGIIVASFVSTFGALLAFLLNRHFLSWYPQHALGIVTDSPKLTKNMPEPAWNPENIGPYELLLLRLVPVFPFFAVNLLAGRSKLSAGTFWLVSQLGMLPATVLLVHGGSALTKL